MSPLRYRITFEDIEGNQFSYSVTTLFGEHKAVALATGQHLSVAPNERIYKVSSVELLPENQPHGEDIVDRMEW